MSGDTSPKIPTNPMDESEKSNSSKGNPEDNKVSTSSGSKGKKKINWRKPMMKCLTLSGRHGERNRN
jgi:hypothetical protein